MNLTLSDRKVNIELTPMERVWGFHFSRGITLSLDDVQAVSAERPANHWKEVRAPGTFVPGLIKAGTYYSKQGRAFWYVLAKQNFLCITLKQGYYKQIVLGSQQAAQWLTVLREALTAEG